MRPEHLVFIFVDGIGLGSADPSINPIAAAELPHLTSFLGGRPLIRESFGAGGASIGERAAVALDATLGTPGLPQSGTGQTALLTGADAPGLLGRHFGPWVPTALRDLLTRENVFRHLLSRGYDVAFANAYPAGHLETGRSDARRPGAFPFAAHAAGILTRDERSVHEHDALVSSITTESWRRHVDPRAPLTTPADSGRTLARIAARHHFTTFAHYDTDFVGHRGGMTDAVRAIERVDEFVGGLLQELPRDALLLITSDHGNLEDVTGGHTLNAVPLLASGPGSGHVVARARLISDVTPLILDCLGGRATGPVQEGSA